MKRLISTSIVLLALLSACTSPKTSAPTTEVAASTAATEPVIVRLVSRDKSITISAGPGHALYSVTDAAGKTVVSKATLDNLKTAHPDLYQHVAPGVTAYAGL